jgi:hypothetical protein
MDGDNLTYNVLDKQIAMTAGAVFAEDYGR